MTPTEAEREILAQAEQVSGYSVAVMQDASLRVLSTVSMARGDVTFHTVRYNPATTRQPEYLVSYQCGFIIRSFQPPAAKRFDISSSERGQRESASIITQHLRKKGKLPLPEEALGNIQQQLYNGLIIQLRSMPIGIRIDEWLYSEFPVLREQQHQSALRQLKENALSLSPQVTEFSPSQIRTASITMNAAFAEFWARLFGEPQLALPYEASGFRPKGMELLDIATCVPDDPSRDPELIDRWGKELGLQNWYAWVPRINHSQA